MQYKVVRECDIDVFQGTVQELLDQGWTLQGGAGFAVNGQFNNHYYIQALVKESE